MPLSTSDNNHNLNKTQASSIASVEHGEAKELSDAPDDEKQHPTRQNSTRSSTAGLVNRFPTILGTTLHYKSTS
jgi:hypothetical protein